MAMSLKQAQELLTLEMQITNARELIRTADMGSERIHVLSEALAVLSIEHEKLIAFHRTPKRPIRYACPECGSVSIRCGCD